ncbi:hypothetical protein [Micromonospora sp. NPDC049204]|uniref:hypothetical protein n=1 Tax=Micromonospora sp. NPDC049204 TaxID=3154351 RepID=UPI0033C57FE1
MNHPSNLHAAANCWSLRRSWAALRDTNSAAATAGDFDGLRSPLYGVRHASGGHADPVPSLSSSGSRYGRATDIVRENVDQAYWLCASSLRHGALTTGPALAVIGKAIAGLNPSTAGEVARYLADADQAARRTLGVDSDYWGPLPGNPPCPGCGVRLLRARTSAPTSGDWPIVCAAGCLCSGMACPCGMADRTPRVAHIWDSAWARVTLGLDATARGETTCR